MAIFVLSNSLVSTSVSITDINKAVFEEAKDVIVAWFSVLTRGPEAVEGEPLGTSSNLLFALRFMLYMALVDILLHVPSVTLLGINMESKPFLVASITGTYIEYLVIGLILHGLMRLFGGNATLQSCIAAYCLLTCYLPIVDLSLIPTQRLVVPALQHSSSFPEQVDYTRALFQKLSTWEVTAFLLSFVVATVVYALFIARVFRSFRLLHNVSTGRTICAFGLGIVSIAVTLAVFIDPFTSSIYSTFVEKAAQAR